MSEHDANTSRRYKEDLDDIIQQVNAREEDIRQLRSHLKAITSHWNEFGPNHGFDEVIAGAPQQPQGANELKRYAPVLGGGLEEFQDGEFYKVDDVLNLLPASPIAQPAMERFIECGGQDELDPVERLRFFCSLAMNGKDWLDVEPLFDAITQPAAIGALVSVDVSTGDHDAGNRIFARIASAMNGNLGEIEYLAEEESRNFAQPAAVEGDNKLLSDCRAMLLQIANHGIDTGLSNLVGRLNTRLANPSAVVAIPEGVALPIQPLYIDDKGHIRFKENKIVAWLLDKGPFDMNQICMQQFPREDEEQFAQLIGYSLSGFGELSYVSDEAYSAAAAKAALLSAAQSQGDAESEANG